MENNWNGKKARRRKKTTKIERGEIEKV